jgi:hypothetical protein
MYHDGLRETAFGVKYLRRTQFLKEVKSWTRANYSKY